jgi:hypothetical protein
MDTTKKKVMVAASCTALLVGLFSYQRKNIVKAKLMSDAVLDKFFSQGYFEARKKFRDAVSDLGSRARLSSYTVCTDDMTGLDLTMDVAVVPGSDPTNLIVHISGVHGAEGFAGSAIQIQALSDLLYCPENPTPTIVFLHALNPYGMLNLRRYNENNVDLNRNAMAAKDLEECGKRDPNKFGYMKLNDVMNPKKAFSCWDEVMKYPRFVKRIFQFGYANIARAFVCGQYHDPKGIMYGGSVLEKNHVIAGDVLKPFAAVAKNMILIDVHSGLGPSGVDTIMVDSETERNLILEVFPHVPRRFIECTADMTGPAGGGLYMNVKGDVAMEYPRLFLGEVPMCLSLTQEFGTVPRIRVAFANVRENAAWQHSRGTTVHKAAAEELRNVFYVQTQEWKTSVLIRGKMLLDRAIRYYTPQCN